MITMTARPAKVDPMPIDSTPGGPEHPDPTIWLTTPATISSGRGSTSRSANELPAPTSAAPNGNQLTDRQTWTDAHLAVAVGDQPPGTDQAAMKHSTSARVTLTDPYLALAANVLDDIEQVRIAMVNRREVLTRSAPDKDGKVKPDKDGKVRGFGLDPWHPEIIALTSFVLALKCDSLAEKQNVPKAAPKRKGCCLEHDAERNLTAKMRKHPLGPWMKSMRGVGYKQGARLLAAIGDPYIRSEISRSDGTVLPEGPRTVGALWALLGQHVVPADQSAEDWGDPGHLRSDTHASVAGVAPKRRRGQKSNWSGEAKKRAYRIAESCRKQLVKPCDADGHVDGCTCSPYRVIYDQRRAHTSHTHPDWTDGHSDNDGLRIAAKAFMKDLWREAKRLHEAGAA